MKVNPRKGVPRTPEVRKKISDARKGIAVRKGYHLSDEHKKKIGQANSGNKNAMSGSKHWRWKGGKETVKQRVRLYALIRRTMKVSNGGVHTLGEWEILKAQYNWTCPCCKRKEPEIKLTADHIIPVIKGGSGNIENIQPLCQSCNSRKKDKIIQKYEKPLA